MVVKNVKVTRKGQITIPIEFREEMGIEEGDTLLVRQSERGLEIERPDAWVDRLSGIFSDYAKDGPVSWDRDEIWAEMALERYERALPEEFRDPKKSVAEERERYDHD